MARGEHYPLLFSSLTLHLWCLVLFSRQHRPGIIFRWGFCAAVGKAIHSLTRYLLLWLQSSAAILYRTKCGPDFFSQVQHFCVDRHLVPEQRFFALFPQTASSGADAYVIWWRFLVLRPKFRTFFLEPAIWPSIHASSLRQSRVAFCAPCCMTRFVDLLEAVATYPILNIGRICRTVMKLKIFVASVSLAWRILIIDISLMLCKELH